MVKLVTVVHDILSQSLIKEQRKKSYQEELMNETDLI